MKKSITALLLLSAVLSYAQSRVEYEMFADAAQENSVLFRGRQATQYPFLYNGVPYWSPDGFKEGSVDYNGKTYYGVLLNIDACVQDLLVKYRPEMPAVALDIDYVTSFVIDGTPYSNLVLHGVKNAEPGYYAVLAEGANPVYFRVDKFLRKSTGGKNDTNIGYDDPDFKPNVLQFFANRARYYTLHNGALKKIGKRRAMKYAGYGK